MTKPIDILILTNGPGEVTTWVRPVVRAIRARLGDDRALVRISVVLSPCPNSTGTEIDVLNSYPEIDRVQPVAGFTNFLLWGKTIDGWDWRQQGVVVFLGGDPFFTVVAGKRLGYKTVVYAEWGVQWLNLIDRFALMNQTTLDRVPPNFAHKCTVVGDLMMESQRGANSQGGIDNSKSIKIGILPGSKAMKLGMGLPLMLGAADGIHARYPEIKFGIPVAPTLDLATLARFGDRATNPCIDLSKGSSAILSTTTPPTLITQSGLEVELYTEFPAYEWLADCTICLTTIGANTAELGALAVPAVILIPIQQLDAMRAWDGILGILVNLPLLGSPIAKLVNWWAYKTLNGRKLAWPNIWAGGEEIMPELVGKVEPPQVAELIIDYLEHPEKLDRMRARLREIRGDAGAADKLVDLVEQSIEDD